VDLCKHEISRHAFNLVYDCVVVNNENYKYDFESGGLV
jgi:hypothetical protein